MSEDMQQQLSELKTIVNGHTQDLRDLKTIVNGHTRELRDLKTITRNTAIVVTGHTEILSRMENLLSKQGGTLDRMEKSVEAFTAEIIASRHERTLMGKSFSDQQEMLTDHELRLTRLEPRDKQS